MKINETKAKLLNDEVVIGTFATVNSAEICSIMASAGYDFILVDFEHGAMGMETLGQQIMAIEHAGASPLVRTPANTMEDIKKCLDTGAYGIMCPMLNNKKDVEDFIKYTSFPPHGVRGFGAVRANNFFNGQKDYIEFEKKEMLRIIQIETKEAVDNIEDILSVEGIDIAFIGPFDLSFSLGVGGDVTNEKVTKAIEKVAEHAKNTSVKLGIMSNPKQLKDHIKLGFKFIILGTDGVLLYNACKESIKLVK